MVRFVTNDVITSAIAPSLHITQQIQISRMIILTHCGFLLSLSFDLFVYKSILTKEKAFSAFIRVRLIRIIFYFRQTAVLRSVSYIYSQGSRAAG